MTSAEADDLLRHSGIRPTPNRTLVLQALAQATRALSLADLDTLLDTLDRSSIFRALHTLADHHLVHSLTDPTGTLRYELCLGHAGTELQIPSQEDDRLRNEHVHFFCERCQQTICLSHIPVPHIALPDGYQPTAATLLLRGTCPHCSR